MTEKPYTHTLAVHGLSWLLHMKGAEAERPAGMAVSRSRRAISLCLLPLFFLSLLAPFSGCPYGCQQPQTTSHSLEITA